MTSLWLYSVVIAPVSLVIGVAASTVGFTAWGLMVPILLVGESQPLFFLSSFLSFLLHCGVVSDFDLLLALLVVLLALLLLKAWALTFCFASLCLSLLTSSTRSSSPSFT